MSLYITEKKKKNTRKRTWYSNKKEGKRKEMPQPPDPQPRARLTSRDFSERLRLEISRYVVEKLIF